MKKVIATVLVVGVGAWVGCGPRESVVRPSAPAPGRPESSPGIEFEEATAEIAAILSDLSSAVQGLERPAVSHGFPDLESAMQALTRVAARIDLFEPRFGIRPETCQGWPAIRSVAAQALEPSRRSDPGGVYFAISSSDLSRAILLEISGDLDSALRALAKIRAGGGCGNWLATVDLAVNTRRSSVLQRQGNFAEALEAHAKAVKSTRLALHSKNLPALAVRHALLLELNDRMMDAVPKYQRVVDIYPGTSADIIARSRLQRRAEFAPPTPSRLRHYLESSDRREGVVALARHAFPESLSMILARLTTDEWTDDRVDRMLEDVGDVGPAPSVQDPTATWGLGRLRLVMAALNGLGDKSRLLRALEHIRTGDWVEVGPLQELLLGLEPDGPRVGGIFESPSPRRCADAWIAYFTTHSPEAWLSRRQAK